ncbi:MAG: hypothetical protein OEP95_09980 [Myxococcales bacterium]|nr:hypothetical protein [Myxococcales bacterium]
MFASLALAPAAFASEPGAGSELDLEGSWHVLVHYTDQASQRPDQEQWDDRLWTFEREGDRLRWLEYPIVVFGDRSGRYESRLSEVHTLGFWEPDEGQQREIESGLEVSPRGASRRTLRRTPAGWSSAPRSAAEAADIVVWQSVWEVALAGDAPTFAIRDSLGNAAVEAIRGTTLYAGVSVLADGRRIEGRYERDGLRHGTFRMTRTGVPGTYEAVRAAEPEKEEIYDRFYAELGRQLRTVSGLPERMDALEGAEREAFRARIRGAVEERYRAQGNDPRPHAPQVEALTLAIEGLYLDDGKTLEEIGLAIESGEVRP